MNRWAKYSHEVNRRPATTAQRTRAFLRSSYLSALSVRLKAFQSPGLSCLFCHNVFDDQVNQFRTICQELHRTGVFVDSDTCLGMVNGRIPIDGNYYHLSFDDGFRNILYNGLPILQEFSIPAAIFVVTGLVGASYEEVSTYCSTRWSVYAAPIEMLSWSDLAEMQRFGITIGSHTRTHARFSTLRSRPQLVDEIATSKRELEQTLGSECRFISWPYGTLNDVTDDSLTFVREAGYAGCFGGYRGSIQPQVTNAFSIPRHHFEPNWPLRHIRVFASGRCLK